MMLGRNASSLPNRCRMSVAEAGVYAPSQNGVGDSHTIPSAASLQSILKRAPAERPNTVGPSSSAIRRFRSEYSLATAGRTVDADVPFPRKTNGTTRKLYDRRAAASLKLTAVGGEWALNACEGHTRWANALLKESHAQITDLRKSISDGSTLVSMVEILTCERLPGIPVGKPSRPSEKTDTLQRCVDCLQAQGVDLQGVTAHELASGNLKSTLMLMTNIRKKYDMDYSEREMMGERTPVGSPHPSRSVPSTPGQGSSSQHPNGALQSGARTGHGSRRHSVNDEIIPGTIRHSNTGHMMEPGPYGASQYSADQKRAYNTDGHYGAAPVALTRTNKPCGSENNVHPPPTSATQAWLASNSAVKSHGVAQHRGTDVGRSPAIERRVNLRSRDRSPAPSGRTGVVNGAFNYEEGELLTPPTPLPLRSRSAQGGVPSPGLRVSYSRGGEDNGTNSYVPSQTTDGAIYGPRPQSAQTRTRHPGVSEEMGKPPQIPPKYHPPPQYSPYVTEGPPESPKHPPTPGNDMRSACSKLYTTSNIKQMNGTCSPHPIPKYPSGLYSNVHARQTPSGSSGSPQSYSSQLSPTLKQQEAGGRAIQHTYGQLNSTQDEEWKSMTPSMSRHRFSGSHVDQYAKTNAEMTPASQRRLSGDVPTTSQRRPSVEMTPTSHRRHGNGGVAFSDGKSMHLNSLPTGPSRENSPNCRLHEGQTRQSPGRTCVGENRYSSQDLHYKSLERVRTNWPNGPDAPGISVNKTQACKQEVTDMLRTVSNPAGGERSQPGISFDVNANGGVLQSGGSYEQRTSDQQRYGCQQMSPPIVRKPPLSTAGRHVSPRSHSQPGPHQTGYGHTSNDTKKLYNSLASDDDDNFSVSSMSNTPPHPALSPNNTPPMTPPLARRHKVAAPTPDVVNSTTKSSAKRQSARKSGGHVSLKTWDGRARKGNAGKTAGRKPRSRSGGHRGVPSHGFLEDLAESDNFDGSTTNLSNTEDNADETTTHELRMMRRQMEGLEAMYGEMLKAVGLDREYSGAGSRHSVSSASSVARSARRFGRQQQQHRQHRELKQVNKRFARLESHVVTLARSVAHLSSEVHSQNALRQDIEALKIDIQDIRKDVKVVGGGKTPLNEWERFRGWVPSLTNPKRVKKLTKFFGQEPPLIHIFLRKLNYEKYIPKFDSEKITMVELPYMTEEMLQKIGIPLGPSRRILQEAQMCFRQENFNIYIV